MATEDRNGALLAVVLAVIDDEAEAHASFTAIDIHRAVRHEIDPAPMDEVEDVLALLGLCMLGGVRSDGRGGFLAGDPIADVRARLRALADSTTDYGRHYGAVFDNPDVDDRY
ncbi:hypothetical protein ACLMAL_39235 [Nocardia sp. CWNU-33]|uniref:hypothetical protein n=1 Tax=Nocardia sp. CWNU-33 TaxID=3392117 RepID=UPI00398E33B2